MGSETINVISPGEMPPVELVKETYVLFIDSGGSETIYVCSEDG